MPDGDLNPLSAAHIGANRRMNPSGSLPAGDLDQRDIKDPALWQALRTAWQPYRHPILYKARSGVGAVLKRIHRTVNRVRQTMG